jgi:hypothetical protein
MKRVFRWITEHSARLFAWARNPKTQEAMADEAIWIVQAASQALPYVAEIARLTPTRTDDEFLDSEVAAVARRYLGTVPAGPLTARQKEEILFEAARTAALTAGLFLHWPGSLIDAAIGVAYRLFKRARQAADEVPF